MDKDLIQAEKDLETVEKMAEALNDGLPALARLDAFYHSEKWLDLYDAGIRSSVLGQDTIWNLEQELIEQAEELLKVLNCR